MSQYSLDSCCQTGTVCGEEKAQLAKCYFEGREYYENQKIYPEEYPCHKCLCTKGFNNETILANPTCQEIKCGYGFETANLKQGCVPIYYGEKGCCNTNWKCRRLINLLSNFGFTNKKFSLSS